MNATAFINRTLVLELVKRYNDKAGHPVLMVTPQGVHPTLPLHQAYASDILLELVQEMFYENAQFMAEHNVRAIFAEYCTLPITFVGHEWVTSEPDYTLWYTQSEAYFEYIIMRNAYTEPSSIQIIECGIYDHYNSHFLKRVFA
jgi:hypothetical protein